MVQPLSLPSARVLGIGVGLVALLMGGCAAAPPNPAIQERLATITPAEVRRHVEALTRDGPRPFLRPARLAATREYIAAELEKSGLVARRETVPMPPHLRPRTLITRFEHGAAIQEFAAPAAYENLLAEIRGFKARELVLEIGAHFDTVPSSPGADDNASGVAGLLAIARALAGGRYERTIRFCFFDLEEVGSAGSREHVRQLAENPRDTVEGVIVLEMIGYTTDAPGSQRVPVRVPLFFDLPTTGNTIFVLGNFPSGALADRFEAAAARYVPALPVYAAGRVGGFSSDSVRSDHGPYWEAGRRGIMLTDTANFRNPHYHRPGDAADTLNYDFLAQVSRAAAATLLEWAKMIGPPASRP